MIKLDAGNVLLKPSHRKQLFTCLRRPARLGERLDVDMTLSMERIGRRYEVRANLHGSAGDADFRCRQRHWQDAVRDISGLMTNRLHEQCLHRGIST